MTDSQTQVSCSQGLGMGETGVTLKGQPEGAGEVECLQLLAKHSKWLCPDKWHFPFQQSSAFQTARQEAQFHSNANYLSQFDCNSGFSQFHSNANYLSRFTVLLFCGCDQHPDQKQFGVYPAYTSTSLFWKALRTGTQAEVEAMEECSLVACSASYSMLDHGPRGGPIHNGLGPPASIKKCPTGLLKAWPYGKDFSISCLLSDDSSFCLVDIKLVKPLPASPCVFWPGSSPDLIII